HPLGGRLLRFARNDDGNDSLAFDDKANNSLAFVVRVRDLTAGKVLTVDAQGKVVSQTDLGKPGGFTTMPIVVDLDGDGRNEIVVQNAAEEIVALRYPSQKGVSASPTILWSLPGVAMNVFPGYTWNGALCPQAADVDGDGRPEVLFAAEDERGLSALVCVDGRGKVKWRRSIEGCPWGGLQAGVDHWTFGRFTGRKQGLDVYVDLHRRSKGSGEGWVLRGDTGKVVWQRKGLVAKETATSFGGGIPSVADVNGDGVDDLVQMFHTVYGAISGNTGEPIFPPAFLWGPNYFGKWLAYSEPTVADLNGDGTLDVYLNSRSYARGAYAAVRADGKPLWAEFHNNDEGSDGLGPVGDFDGDGKLEIGVPVLNGTLLCLNAADGSHKWRIQTPVTGDVIAADVNSDGIMELLFAGRDGKLRAVNGKDGRAVWSIAASGQPIVADVDGDGWVEVLAVGNDGVLRVIGETTSSHG
ncbi:MAG: FG-GAP-like repeat-containing protein, partial [Abditibacteriales bacterium]|nr:FG-GAP-like repeat-containing protein [Abditibacteriales bacterium]